MDNLIVCEKELKKEQAKLDRLIDRALGEPIKKNEEILRQSRIVDALLEKIQKGK